MSANRLLQHLRDFIRRQSGGGSATDGQLLERFLKERDETAFEVLVWRHGPMVLALGQRILGNVHDAEDVLQATFLTLVRKAGSIGKSEALSSWLYRVAYRIALRSRARAAKRATVSRCLENVPAMDKAEESVWRELRPLLDAAIERLPEKYRTAIVLCDLQGKTHREAAEQLGCSIGTISTRVTRARHLLRKRLAHHAPALTIGVLSAALAQRTAAALPATLTATTVRTAARLVSDGAAPGMLSASVAEMMEGANQAMSMSRFKILIFVALAVGVVTVGAASRAALRREPPVPRADTPPAEAKTKSPAEKPAPVTVRGRVLDPEGKPVQGARLYWPRLPKSEPFSEEDIEIPQRAKTDAEGRFHFELPRTDIHPEWKLALLAAAEGYGVDWVELPKGDSSPELTLRLVKDQPIEGRIISTEGKPLAGVHVRATGASKTLQGRLNDFLAVWKQDWQTALQQQSPPQLMLLPPGDKSFQATTDKGGRFRLTAAGSERLVFLRVRGPGLTPTVLHVINRSGFDAAALNKSVLDRIPAELRLPGQPPLLYGPKLEYVTAATRIITGTVRAAENGEPLAGFRIHINTGYGDGISAMSDKNGHYKLEGIPKTKQYLLNAEPPARSSWLPTGARPEDAEGLQPLRVDFTVARGIVVRGRVLDRATGKGVRGGIRFVPLPGNKFARKPGYDFHSYDRMMRQADSSGRFQLPVIPGPGVLMVQAYGASETANGGQKLNPYKQAEFDAKDREKVKVVDDGTGNRFVTAVDNSVEFLSIENAVKYLDLAADAGTATCDLFVERGVTQIIHIKDAEGEPLKGTMVAGVTASWPNTFTIPDATCTVFALDPKKPRRLLLFHAADNLAGTLTLRGDEKESPIVRLKPAGSVMGRILDRDGQPFAGADIELSAPDRIASEFYRQLRLRQQPIRTDKEGRFRVAGIVPQVKFTLSITKGRTFFVGEPRIGVKEVKPGETLDLGDVRVKPGQ